MSLLICLLILFLAAALRLLNLDQSLDVDEAGSIALASSPDFWTAARQDVHPPFYYELLHLGLKLTSSFLGLRFFSVVSGLALVALAMFSLRRSLPAMIVAGLTAGALPAFIHHSQQLRPYALLFLLLALALVLSVRIFTGANDFFTRGILCFVLVAAAATHLVTAFFLVALAPLLLWPIRHRGQEFVPALLPLLPAGALLLWLKFAFVSQPHELVEGWWIPAVNPGLVLQAVKEATGWTEIKWFADACARRAPWSGAVVQGIAAGAVGFAAWTAWCRSGGALAWALFGSALIYTAALVGYSYGFESIVMGRTLLPAILLFAAGLAWGIGTHPVAWRRTVAVTAVGLYLSISAATFVRRAFSPPAGLRGLAAEARKEYRPGDVVILFRTLNFGLVPYWNDFSGSAPLHFDETQRPAPQLSKLDQRLSTLDAEARVWVAYREDLYLARHRDFLAAVLRKLSESGRTARVRWHEADLTLLLTEPSLHP